MNQANQMNHSGRRTDADNMQAYPSYKPSNIDWIGEIPSHWKLTKVKFQTSIVVDGTHFTPEYTDSGVPFLRVTDVQSKEIDFDSIKFISKKEHLELVKRCKPQRGDLLLSKNGTIGKTKIVDWDWEFSIFVSLCLIRFKSTFDAKLFSFFFQSYIIDQQLVESSKQSTVTNLHLDKIRELLLICPPLPEQQAIVKYLDQKTTLIDELIAKKQSKIELLKEQRTALINHAVTKGLNDEVEMKDSGIEWIGEIPEHWEAVSLRRLLTILTDYDANGSFSSIKDNVKRVDNESDRFAWFVRATDLESLNRNEEDDKVWVDEQTYNYLSKSKLYGGEILIAKRGEIGKIYRMPFVNYPCSLAPNLYLVRMVEKVNTDYLFYFMISSYGNDQLKIKNNSTTLGALYKDDLKDIICILPPIPEQKAIVAYLDEQTALIDKGIALESQKIEKLKEYRQSLISAVVTGKICVLD